MHFWPSNVVVATILVLGVPAIRGDNSTCAENPLRRHLIDGPYDNYFFSDCHSSAHVIISSPLSTSNLNVIKPRLLVAWPAGNSGLVSVFAPANGQPGTLSIEFVNSSSGQPLEPIYSAVGTGRDSDPLVGVSGTILFNSSATLTVAILGSIRNIRDYTEGGGILNEKVQAGLNITDAGNGSKSIQRTWFDNATTTYLTFSPLDGATSITATQTPEGNTTLQFGAGTYQFNASFDYPQMTQLSPQQVLNPISQSLIQQDPDQTLSLSFLSYNDKLVAGTWRFLTYFGRDSMISALLLRPVLSEGEGGAIEAVISAVLERINRTDGTACHEESIGDFATLANLEDGIISNAPQCDYKMIDTDYYLPILMKNYFVDSDTGKTRAAGLLNTSATFISSNSGVKYADLAKLNVEKIMRTSAKFAADGGQISDNLVHLNPGVPVGQWRDSNNGLGGGRVPYDVNTALVPAALRSIAALSRAGFFPDHSDWKDTADQYAQVWEDETLRFFEINVTQSDAVSLVQAYVGQSEFPGPSNSGNITSDVQFYGLALNGSNNQPVVKVMNTDDCFRHFLLNTTNESQLTSFLNQTADHVLQPFPVGLSSSVGLFVANPAYGGDLVYAENFTNRDYHGIVVWSWQLAMMAQGLARQLGRCRNTNKPNFCEDSAVYYHVIDAYNHLWDLIDANRDQLSGEVWSWSYNDGFQVEALGALTSTESDVRQLWSLTFLALNRESFEYYGTVARKL